MEKIKVKDKQSILKKIESLNNEYLHILLSECTVDISCPHCNSKEYKKYGKTTKGIQRYRCKSCKKTYVENYHSALFKTHKDNYQWFIFLQCYLNGDILDICAKEANIHHNTAFRWRHKLNDAFLLSMNASLLTDEVYLDETLYPRIEKANEELIYMKRNKAKRGISDQKVNICCAIDSNNHTVIRVSDCGRIKSDKLINIFSDSIGNDVTLITDSLRSYHKFVDQLDVLWKKIPSKKKSIDGYTLDKVNHLHSRIKQYLSKFKGISYKFLQGYITMFQINEIYKSCTDRNWKYEVFTSLMSFKTTLRCAHIDKGLVKWTV